MVKFIIIIIFFITFQAIPASFDSDFKKFNNDLYDDNVLINSNFDNGLLNWSGSDLKNFKIHNKNSLFYDNTADESYSYITQDIKAIPESTLNISVLVKGIRISKINNTPSGAGIFVLGKDKYGKVIDSENSNFLNGTFNWKKLIKIYYVPSDAVTVTVGIYLKKGTVGKVWFDNISARYESKPFLSTKIIYPNYRNTVGKYDDTNWVWEYELSNLATEYNYSVVTELKNMHKDLLVSKKTICDTLICHIELSRLRNLPVGDYFISQRFYYKGRSRVTEDIKISIVDEMPTSYIDKDSFFIKNNVRFFPIGIYSNEITVLDIEKIKSAGFNSILSYNYGSSSDYLEFMSAMKNKGMYVIYSLGNFYNGHRWKPTKKEPDFFSSEIIEKLKNDNTLLAWYINDELEPYWLPKIEAMYNKIIKVDNSHPVVQTLYQLGSLNKYYDSTDILSIDHYRIGLDKNTSSTFIYARKNHLISRNSKSPWYTVQLSDVASYRDDVKSHQPNYLEIKNQIFTAIIAGSKGLLFYSYRHLNNKSIVDAEKRKIIWDDISKALLETSEVLPIVLHGHVKVVEFQYGVSFSIYSYGEYMCLIYSNQLYQESVLHYSIPKDKNNYHDVKTNATNEVQKMKLSPLESGFKCFKNEINLSHQSLPAPPKPELTY